MTPALIFTEGPLAGRRLEIDAELVIGREDAGLTIEDPELSRLHAVVRPGHDGCEIEDLGSLNGTFVNGNRIGETTRLAGGDTVKLGRSVLQIEAAPADGDSGPTEPFGTYASPVAAGKRSGIASRRLGPQLVSFAVVAATAVALVFYFAER